MDQVSSLHLFIRNSIGENHHSFIFFFLFFDLVGDCWSNLAGCHFWLQETTSFFQLYCIILFETFDLISTKFCLAAARAFHRVRENFVPSFQPRAEWRPSVSLVGRLASGWWIVRESLGQAGAGGCSTTTPPHWRGDYRPGSGGHVWNTGRSRVSGMGQTRPFEGVKKSCL